MTETAASMPIGSSTPLVRFAPLLFGITVFTSAALVFLVEPMIAKMVLPTLGGSPAVWNTCMAFFQAALLVGYGYAHLLQRVKSLKLQTAIHAAVLLAACLALPLRVTEIFGEPSGRFPILWLLGVLAVSLGAPFAALSATAPLAQAWYARVRSGQADASNPYVLYVASNLGSLIALIAYPVIVEPSLLLSQQRFGWTGGYVAFLALMLLVAVVSARTGASAPPLVAPTTEDAPAISWRDRLIWVALAAIPSSLMLGVTTHITTDVASAPFLWVAPLALYLLTFIIAFSSRPIIPHSWVLVIQAAAIAFVVWSLGLKPNSLLLTLAIHLAGFFLTALLCHQSLAQRRPHPARLTEFYLLMSVGGVIGGGFNAFLAPLIFNGVWEYPLVLILSCLARPWGRGKLTRMEQIISYIGLGAALIAVSINQAWARGIIQTPHDLFLATMLAQGPRVILTVAPVCAFLLRNRAVYFTLLILAIAVATQNMTLQADSLAQARSFFGVLRITEAKAAGYADHVRLLANGTTLHGAQAMDAADPCRPLTYYAPETPIGQVILSTGTRKRNMVVGAVGMGAGTVAAYARPDDEYRFYEIDPLVIAITTQPKFFTYIKGCAKTPKVDWRLGDARISLQKEPSNAFDVLLVDAFSSDAVPAHLLTVEAMKLYLDKVGPEGIVIMHLSNRHLDLRRPVAAVAKAAGAYALLQQHRPIDDVDFVNSAEDVIIVGKTEAALAPYRADPRWRVASIDGVRPWTDDYTNIVSAMMRRLRAGVQ